MVKIHLSSRLGLAAAAATPTFLPRILLLATDTFTNVHLKDIWCVIIHRCFLSNDLVHRTISIIHEYWMIHFLFISRVTVCILWNIIIGIWKIVVLLHLNINFLIRLLSSALSETNDEEAHYHYDYKACPDWDGRHLSGWKRVQSFDLFPINNCGIIDLFV